MTEPKQIDPKRLVDASAFVRACRGERDDNGYLIEGPEWDSDDVVGVMRDVLDDRDAIAQQWADALNENSRRSHEHYEAMKAAVETLAKQQNEIQGLRTGLQAIQSAATKVGPGLILTETVATMAENLLAGRAVDHGI